MKEVHEPRRNLAVDGDAVIVVQRDQLVQLPGTGQRAGFMADAFHQATVAQEHIGVVVNDGMLALVELGGQQLLSQREADGIGDALAQRAGGGFHTRGNANLRVTCRLAVQLAEVLQLRQRQIVARQMQQCIDQHRTMAVRENEAVAVGPVRVRGVVLQVLSP